MGRRVFAALIAMALGGCTMQEFSRNAYEGGRSRHEALKSTPAERASPPAPDHDEYERERRGLAEPSAR